VIGAGFFGIFLLALSTLAQAATALNEAICERHSITERETKIKAGEKLFTVVDSDKDCNSEYLYYRSITGDMVILSGPTEDQLGLNAQNEIFIAPVPSDIARNIGSIPVSAILDGDERFINIVQVGGSIFEVAYKIHGRQLSPEPSNIELIFSGSQCIYQDKQIESCTNLTGSFKNPICVRQIHGRKIKQRSELCSDLKKEIQE